MLPFTNENNTMKIKEKSIEELFRLLQ